MKRSTTLVAMALLSAALAVSAAGAAKKHAHGHVAPAQRKPYYANTPSDIIPYHRMAIKPYHDNFYAEPQRWNGPGREIPEPKVQTVRLGWLGTLDPKNPLGGYGKQMLQGTQLAVEEANRAGGYKGKPFELMVHEDRARWGDSSNEMIHMICDDQVWGVLGTVDSANSHVMMRVTLKLPVPVVNSATTDQTLMEHRVPFITRVIPDDRQYAYATAWYLFREKGYSNVAMIRINNRDGRFSIRKLMDASRRLGHPIQVEVRFNDGATDFSEQLSHMRGLPLDAVIVWGNAPEAALVVKQMRAMGMKQPVVGWFRSVSPKLIEMGGKDVEGMVCAYPFNPQRNDPLYNAFHARYVKRFGMEPDVFAAYAYDGENALINAIRKAGLNRIKIADALEALQTMRGVTGTLAFDGARDNVCPIWMAEVRNGRFHYRPAGFSRYEQHPAIASAARAR